MASSFFGLYVQRDAIQIAQKSLDITGHNISNINTEGYSRQRVDVVSVANTKGTLGYNTSVSLAGKGADALGVTQIRDKLLDVKVRKYSSELCDTGAKTTILSDIEDILDDVENEETGLAAILGNWKASFQSFSATGADRKDLSNIAMNSAQSVLNVLKNFETRLNDCETAAEKDIENTNTRINAILKEMASLNKQIEDAYVQMNDVYATPGGYQAELSYGPLELKDQFNTLADELSQYMNITVTEQLEGSYTVEFGDRMLVCKDSYAKTDIKFRSDFEDEITDAAGNKIENVLFLEKEPMYDADGKEIAPDASGNIPAGTKLYYSDGKDSGLTADGNGGYVDADGNSPTVYIVGKSKFFDESGNEITNWGTVNDGAKVTDENGNTITVNGNFDAECIKYTFTELYVSSSNTAKEWDKTKRELTPELEKAGMGDMINKINSLIESGDVEEALRYEKEIMAKATEKSVTYKPVFKENITEPVNAKGEIMYPSYAISVSDETDTITGGSIKGLFDMYNGEGVYSGVKGNSYQGIKYYQETIRSLSTSIAREFNALYDDYNSEAKTKAGDDAVKKFLETNPAASESEKDAARLKAEEEYVPFKMFEFNGSETVSNLKIAETWKENPLRCVHPQGTEEEDYNYDELDNKYLNKLLSAFEKKHDFGSETQEYTFEEFVAYYGNTVGSQLEYELSDFDATTTMYESVANAREEVMGVQMDEEGVNMMNYQKWYNAISRMITAMDQCLDKLINGTGVVGL